MSSIERNSVRLLYLACGSEAGSYEQCKDLVYHLILGLRVIKKKKKKKTWPARARVFSVLVFGLEFSVLAF